MQNNLSINIQQIINNPIKQSQWHQLQIIMYVNIKASKLLNDHMQKCVKNRDYIQAQKAKDKIEEAQDCIIKRKSMEIDDRTKENMKRLESKHEEQRQQFYHQWDMKVAMRQQKFQQIVQKKIKLHQQQKAKLRQQIELALPVNHTPDDKLKSLRNEEKRFAQQGKFLEAQRIKVQIEHREQALQQKHRRLRQSNIKSMIDQLNEKHDRDLKQRQKEKKIGMDEIIQERNRKLKQLEDRHAKQLREAKWMHGQEKKMRMTSGKVSRIKD